MTKQFQETDDYEPTPYEQRPPVDMARARLTRMLDETIGMAYSMGSVGGTQVEQDPFFKYEATYKITRRTDNTIGRATCATCQNKVPVLPSGRLQRHEKFTATDCEGTGTPAVRSTKAFEAFR